MKTIDHKTLFNALAFLAIVQKGMNAENHDAAEQIRQLAGRIETFCSKNAVNGLAAPSDDADATIIDREIERYIQELRQKQETRLPQNREGLIELYDRLCQRKTQRMQRDLYANATEAELADLALQYLDEEIEDIKIHV